MLADEYTEEVLEAHDKELQRLKDYYQETEHIYTKMKQRQEVNLGIIMSIHVYFVHSYAFGP